MDNGVMYTIEWPQGQPSLADAAHALHVQESDLDPSFGVGGVKTFNDAATEAVRAMVPHGTGLLLAEDPTVGSAPQFVVARIGPTGAPDASFGAGGRLVDPFSGNGGGAGTGGAPCTCHGRDRGLGRN